jgi:excinuclease ABC subunit C
MNTYLESKIKNIPNKPGIYQFKNDKGKVIYVGKAVNLRNRVRSYFVGATHSAKTTALVNKTHDVELIITDNEVEALVLENNLIKDLKPRYNVNLKDDKSYPFIKVSNEPYPRIYPTRRLIRDGSKYFGPYTSVHSMKTSLRMINQLFKIRSCKLDITQSSIEKKKFKVCLDYHIKKCDGPCEGLISEKVYGEMVGEVVKVLKGKTDDLIDDLNLKMKGLVENLEFEKAAELRDRLEQLKIISSKQKVVSDDFQDRDIISIAYQGKDSACSVFNVRNGKLVGKKQLRLSIEEGEEPDTIYSAAVKFYYNDFADIPKEIVIEVAPADMDILSEWLSLKTHKKVKLIVPQKGNLKSLIRMCSENALLQLKEIQIQKMKNEGQISYSISALQRDLSLPKLPIRIECFDISNLQGTDTVASLVVFENGKPKRSQYRKYIIKGVSGPDDFLSMQEVIERRYTKVVQGEAQLPDLIMVDGGKGQLSSAIEVLNELKINNYNIIGLAKRLEEVFLPGQSEPASISKTSSGLKLLQRIRNEAHRFAVTFHRERRSKRTIKTELTDIKGIGASTAQKLLKEFGSVSQLKNSDHDKLVSLIGKQKADLIKQYFEQNAPGSN